MTSDEMRYFPKLFLMNVPAHGAGGALAYNFAERRSRQLRSGEAERLRSKPLPVAMKNDE